MTLASACLIYGVFGVVIIITIVYKRLGRRWLEFFLFSFLEVFRLFRFNCKISWVVCYFKTNIYWLSDLDTLFLSIMGTCFLAYGHL